MNAEAHRSESDMSWSEHPIGSRTATRLCVQLPFPADAISLLTAAQGWAFVWKGRDNDDLTLAIDALACERDARQIRTDASLPWFGGRAFFDENRDEALWEPFGSQFWFLPVQRWTLRAESSELTLLAWGTGPDVRMSLRKSAQKLERLAMTRISRPVAPQIVSRHDLPAQGQWRSSIHAAQAQFPRMSKIVMSRTARIRLNRIDSWLYFLQHLLGYREESYVYALKSPGGKVFMGRSPERLLGWHEGRFHVDAIAGTRRRGNSQSQDRAASMDLLQSRKEQSEHRFVTHYVTQLLEKLDLDFAQIDDEKLLMLTHLQHMRSRFSGQFSEITGPLALLEELHPTPAVGGSPKALALPFIRANEAYDRGWYAGFIGWYTEAAGECAIGIRSALIEGDSLRIFAGAGIVADSDADAEWEETELKMQTFLSGLDRPAKRSVQAKHVEY